MYADGFIHVAIFLKAFGRNHETLVIKVYACSSKKKQQK